MFKRILVPLDGSPLAETVLPKVQELVQALGAELFLLRVTTAHVFPGVDPTAGEVDVVQHAEAYIAVVAARLRPCVDIATKSIALSPIWARISSVASP